MNKLFLEKNEPKAFIQVITNNTSYFVNYDIDEFRFNCKPFCIKIGNSSFSKEGIHIDIKDEGLIINGDIQYLNNKNINTNLIKPNIMGPFSIYRCKIS